MAARSVSLGAMFGWIGATFRLLGRNPGALMGASAISLVVYLLIALPIWGYMGWQMYSVGLGAAAQPGFGGAAFWWLYAATMVASLVLLPPMRVGWFRLARAVDADQPARASDVLAPYQDREAWMRALATYGLMILAFAVVAGAFAAVFWGSIQDFMAQVAADQAAMLAGNHPEPHAPPVGLILGYLLMIVLFLVGQAIFFVALSEVSLTPASPVAAISDAGMGVLRNAHKLLLFGICVTFVASVAMVIVMVVLGALIAALSLLGFAVAMIAVVLLYIPVVLLMYPLMFGGSYLVWKSMLGEPTPPPVPGAGARDDVLTA